MVETVVSLDNVSKYYKLYDSPKLRLKEALHPFGKKYHRPFYAIRNVSFALNQGEVLGIIGKNGSGKSTLLKLIAGVLMPNNGSVSVTGNVNALLELGSGLNTQFTGLQNIYFMGRIQGISEDEMESKVEEIIEFSELGDFIHQPLRNYSSGMKSRLAFSVATTIQPEILILDEVLSVGDVRFRRKCITRMEELVSGDSTVLFVSHNEQSIKSICTQALLLDNGTLIHYGQPDETVDMYLDMMLANDVKVPGNRPDKDSNEEILDSDSDKENEPGKIIRSKSRQYIRNYNADITDIELVEKENKEPVKILKTGNQYLIRFSAELHEAYDNISGSAAIVDEKGIRISGIAPKLAGKVVKNDHAGVIVPFEFNFNCLLLPGSYYLGVSIRGDVQGRNELLCAIRDAACLQVTSYKDECKHKFGLIDLLD